MEAIISTLSEISALSSGADGLLNGIIDVVLGVSAFAALSS